jgi:hypothetical protein
MDDHQHQALEQTLEACLDAIATQGWSVDDCLAQYGAYSDSLKPLLDASRKLVPARQVQPSPAFRLQAVARLRVRLSSARPRPVRRPAAHALAPVSRIFAGMMATLVVVGGLVVAITVVGDAPKGEQVQPATAESGGVTSPAVDLPTAVTEAVGATADTGALEADIDRALQELDGLNASADMLDDEP